MANTFVLVHGAWHGAWCWAAVMRQLEVGGDHAFAVDLPGRGANPCDHATVTRASWVESVVRLIEERDLRSVVLAGHSLGGLTIAGVAQRIPQRIKRVVFVSAYVPRDGASLIEDAVEAAGGPQAMAQHAFPHGAASTVINPDNFRRHFMQDASRDLQDFVIAAAVPEAIAPAREPVPMKEFQRLDLPTGYIVCTEDLALGDPARWHPHFSSRLRNPEIRSIKSGHEVMFTRPRECAAALAELAAI
jgi:pimeloyl-ACP methyl ester carboxylesterase